MPVAPEDGWINHPSHHALNDLMKTIRKDYKIEENWDQRSLKRFGKMPVRMIVAKNDKAGITINEAASKQLKKAKTPVTYTVVNGDTPRLESLYNSKLLTLMGN